MSAGERRHGPLRKNFEKIVIECPKLDHKIVLQIAAKGLKDTAGPEDAAPAILAFGMAPKIPLGHISSIAPNQRERLAAMELARRQMETISAELRIKAESAKRSPDPKKLEASKGDQVLALREKSQR